MISPAIRLYVYAAAALMLFAGIYSYHRVELNGARKAGYQQARAEMAAEVAKANADAAETERRKREQSHRAGVAWEKERNELQSQIDGLLLKSRQPIRLCRDGPGGGQLPRDAQATSSIDDSTRTGVDDMRLGDDISGAILMRAGQCERYRLQLRALQSWILETH